VRVSRSAAGEHPEQTAVETLTVAEAARAGPRPSEEEDAYNRGCE
jgi:hypothetical protein